MARYTESVCRLCRRENLKLFLKGERCYTDKCAIERRNYPPGEHGQARPKFSEYSIQLAEKQKAKHIYGLLERQFENLYKEANRQKGVTGENLLRMLEQRLDNIVFRAGWARTRPQARQFVNHGLIDVNGRRVDIPSYRVKKGDVVSLREKTQAMIVIQHNLDTLDVRLPAWMDQGEAGKSITVRELPMREQIDVPVREQLIVELYSK